MPHKEVRLGRSSHATAADHEKWNSFIAAFLCCNVLLMHQIVSLMTEWHLTFTMNKCVCNPPPPYGKEKRGDHMQWLRRRGEYKLGR